VVGVFGKILLPAHLQVHHLQVEVVPEVVWVQLQIVEPMEWIQSVEVVVVVNFVVNHEAAVLQNVQQLLRKEYGPLQDME
jgi:hypothetical protein